MLRFMGEPPRERNGGTFATPCHSAQNDFVTKDLMASLYQWDAPAAPHPARDADLQRRLAEWNRSRLAPQFPTPNWRAEIDRDAWMRRAEIGLLERLREEAAGAAADAPSDPDGFIAWYEALKQDGPGQGDPLFPWIANEASLDDMRWFLEQEAAGEAGFDDLVAMTQVKLPKRAKLELARNYWDEMATNRRYAWHAVGALGIIELTAPGRSACTAAALRRLGFPPKVRRYFDLHATLDVRHSAAWNAEALRPLVDEDPHRARAIAEGALIRLACGARCYERYRAHLWRGRIAVAAE
jgi:Iron-containing redox enzyme